jgi:hypothetical protein
LSGWYDTYIEFVYSYRTGKKFPSDPIAMTQPSDGWGIRQPVRTGSLAEQLADRKRYYEDVLMVAAPAETQSGSVSTDRYSATDTGHLFQSTKVLRCPPTVYGEIGSGTNTGGVWTQYFKGTLPLNVGVTPAWLKGNTVGSTPAFSHLTESTTQLQKTGLKSNLFANTAPERQTASILVTVLELLKGDIPSVVKNIQKRGFQVHSKLSSAVKADFKYLGSEYLNSVFGWSPLVREVAGVLTTLLAIDRMVYSESNRRQRRWDGPSVTTLGRSAFSFGDNPYTLDATFRGWDNRGTYLTPLISPIFDTKVLVKEDYAFSSRYSALVKPTSRSNKYAERADEVLRQLGLADDPTLLWEILPWSWLVDWAANIGNDLVNAHTYSPITGRHAVDYAYFTTQLSELQEWNFSSPGTVGTRTKKWSMVRPNGFHNTRQRVRERATPFGFGTQLGSLSGSQFAILTALGLARAR